MRGQPKGDGLLACARQMLRDEVMPALPADRKYVLLMVMNAMSIAERELRNGDAPEAQELAELHALLGDSRLPLAESNRRLARLLRAGGGDPGESRRAALLAHLRAAGRRRLAESNPKALPAEPR